MRTAPGRSGADRRRLLAARARRHGASGADFPDHRNFDKHIFRGRIKSVRITCDLTERKKPLAEPGLDFEGAAATDAGA